MYVKSSPDHTAIPQNSCFTPTRWSLVRRAAIQRSSGGSGPDLEEFCRIYWYPLYAAARREGLSQEDAGDTVQDLFAGLMGRNLLEKADAARGQLRSWLLTMLRNQICSRMRKENALKRGGGVLPFRLDSEAAEAAWRKDPALSGENPLAAWRRDLAVTLLDTAVEALVAAETEAGRGALVNVLLPTLEGHLPDSTFEETAERLGMKGGALRMKAKRLRERWGKILRAKASVALGIGQGPALERELRDLFAGTP